MYEEPIENVAKRNRNVFGLSEEGHTNLFGIRETGRGLVSQSGQDLMRPANIFGLNESGQTNIFGIRETGPISISPQTSPSIQQYSGIPSQVGFSTNPSQVGFSLNPSQTGFSASPSQTGSPRNQMKLITLNGVQYVVIDDLRYNQKEGRYKNTPKFIRYEEFLRRNKEGIISSQQQPFMGISGAGPGIGFNQPSTYGRERVMEFFGQSPRTSQIPTQKPSSFLMQQKPLTSSYSDIQYERAKQRIELGNQRAEMISKYGMARQEVAKAKIGQAAYYEKMLKAGLPVKTETSDYLFGSKYINPETKKLERVGGAVGFAKDTGRATKAVYREGKTIAREGIEIAGPALRAGAKISKEGLEFAFPKQTKKIKQMPQGLKTWIERRRMKKAGQTTFSKK